MQRTVDLRLIEQEPAGWVEEHVLGAMREQLAWDLERLGRQQWGDATVYRDEDVMRAVVEIRLMVQTRERTDGEWPAIWAAIHEDQWDRMNPE